MGLFTHIHLSPPYDFRHPEMAYTRTARERLAHHEGGLTLITRRALA